MTKYQADELIAVAWLAMAAFDKPFDAGSLIYIGLSALAGIRSLRGRLAARRREGGIDG